MKNVTRTTLLFILMSGWACFLSGQTLICNEEVNISLDASGTAIVTPQMVLEGNYDFSVLTVSPAALSTADIGIVQYTVVSSVTGNTCWGQIIVEDKIGGGGNNDNLACNALINISLNGQGSAAITPQMVLAGGPYDYSEITVEPAVVTEAELGIVTYTATASNGNFCWGQLLVEDGPGSGGNNNNLACYDQVNVSLNGQNSVGVSPQMVLAGGPYDYAEITVEPAVVTSSDIGLVTYTATASNGNLCWGTLTVSLNLEVPPVVTVALDGQAQVNLSPEMLLSHPQSDYSVFTISPEYVTADDLGSLDYTITNSITGETVIGTLYVCATTTELMCDKVIIIIDETGVDTFDISFTSATWDDSCNPGGYNISMSSSSNNVTEVVMTCDDLTTFGNYQIYLWSGNTVVDECENLLQVLDPFAFCNPATSLSCNAEVNVSVEPWKCSVDVTPEMLLEGAFNPNFIELSENELGLGRHIVTATDTSSGNTCWGHITVEDNTPPVGVVSENIVVALVFNPNDPDNGTAKVYAQQVDNGSYDSCSDVALSPAFWKFDCSDIGTQIVELTVTDAAGNFNKVWTEILIQSNQQFDFTCPDDVVASCSTDIGDETIISDLLGNPSTNVTACAGSVTYRDLVTGDLNGDGQIDGSVVGPDGNTYQEGGACENKLVNRMWSLGAESCSQLIFLTYDSDFEASDIVWPEDVEYKCSGNSMQQPTWPDNATCDQLLVSVESDTFRFEADACMKIINNWTVINWCNNALYTQSSVVKIIDNEAPTVEPTENVILGGLSNNNLITATAEGNCPHEEFKWQVVIDIDNDWSQDLEFSSFVEEDALSSLWDDDNGNGIPDVRVGNQGEVDNQISDSTQPGEVYGIKLPSFISANVDVLHRIEWKVFDGCGNTNTVTSYFEVRAADEDVTAPTPYCINLSTSLTDQSGEVELYAIDFNLGSFDNITDAENLRFTFSELSPEVDPGYDTNQRSSLKQFSLDGESIKIYQESIYVWDEAGNSDFCLVNVRIVKDQSQLDFEPIEFCFPKVTANQGDRKCIPLTAKNFNRVSSFDCTVSWNPEVMDLVDWNNGTIDLLAFNLNLSSVDQGLASISWFDGTAVSPVTAPEGEAIFELCFDIKGGVGDETTIALTDDIVELVVSSAGASPIDPSIKRSILKKDGALLVTDGDCDVTISWPEPVLEVYINDENNLLIEDLIEPSYLIGVVGFDESEVIPNFQSNCLLGWNLSDQILPLASGLRKVLRTFMIINWDTGETFEFVQIIKVEKIDSFICDFLPNDAPLGDCDSGHTDTDDVEWPADISISDHRTTPEELVLHSDIPVINSEPQFFNSPDLYLSQYEDIVDELTMEILDIDRIWTITRVGSPGYVWNFTQDIRIDLVELTNLVSVTTHTNKRAMPRVDVTDQIETDLEGMAIVEANEEIELYYDDADLNGRSIRDLILMRNHILGISDLAPIQQLAADVTESGGLSTADLVLMRDNLLGLERIDNSNWYFFDEFEMAAINQDPSSVVVDTRGEYTGIKLGDVDDDAILNSQTPDLNTMSVTYQDQILNAGQIYSVPFIVDQEHRIWGFSERFFIDDELIEIIDVSSPLFNNEVAHSVVDQMLLDTELVVLSTALAGRYETVPAQSALFTVEIRALKNTILSTALTNYTLTNDFLSVAVKNDDLEKFVLQTQPEGIIGTSILDLNGTALKVYPNPATDVINLEFSENEKMADFMFRIYDATGKTVLTSRNQQRIDVNMLDSGYYMYSIEMNNEIYSDRLIIQK